MQICDTFGLSFLHTLVSIIFPTGNACVPADESPPCRKAWAEKRSNRWKKLNSLELPIHIFFSGTCVFPKFRNICFVERKWAENGDIFSLTSVTVPFCNFGTRTDSGDVEDAEWKARLASPLFFATLNLRFANWWLITDQVMSLTEIENCRRNFEYCPHSFLFQFLGSKKTHLKQNWAIRVLRHFSRIQGITN